MSEEGRKRFYDPKVKFNLQPVVHLMIYWNYAYRQARKSNWIQLIADRERFKQRILKFENKK